MKPTRLTYTIVCVRGRWTAFAPGVVRLFPDAVPETRAELVRRVAFWLRSSWRVLRLRSELVVFRLDGTIGERRTYGRDPRKSKG